MTKVTFIRTAALAALVVVALVSRSTPVRVGGLTDVVAIAAGGYHSLAIRSDGTLWTWGWNYLGQLGDGSTVDRWRPKRSERTSTRSRKVGAANSSMRAGTSHASISCASARRKSKAA